MKRASRFLLLFCTMAVLSIFAGVFLAPTLALIAIPFGFTALQFASLVGEIKMKGLVVWDDDLHKEIYQVVGKGSLYTGGNILFLRDKNSRLIATHTPVRNKFLLHGHQTDAQFLIPVSMASSYKETSGGKGLEIES